MDEQERKRFEEWARPDSVQAKRHPETGEYTERGMSAAWAGWQAAVKIERERICAAIKAEDDHCADGDYMMDSDDCIKVVRGTWERPDWNGSNAELCGPREAGNESAAGSRSARATGYDPR